MIVIMVGLPGTGKSTLARRLARELNGLVIDKDSVRAALFGEFVDYTREQDDLAMECVYSAARYMAHARVVFIDGRAFALRYQWERALEMAGGEWRVIETVCSDEVARARLESAMGLHLAANRSFELYLELKVKREKFCVEKLMLDTGRSLEECVEESLAYLRQGLTLREAIH